MAHQKWLKKTGDADLNRLRRDLTTAFKHGMAGLDVYAHMTTREFADVLLRSGLAKYGVPCTMNDVQNGKKRPFEPHSTPRMARVIEVIRAVRGTLPNLDIDEILSEFSNEQPLRDALDGTCQFTSRLTTA